MRERVSIAIAKGERERELSSGKRESHPIAVAKGERERGTVAIIA